MTMNCTEALPHYCGIKSCEGNVPHGKDSEVFCNAAHPTLVEIDDEGTHAPKARCRRMPQHDGDHSAYTFSISIPERWPA